MRFPIAALVLLLPLAAHAVAGWGKDINPDAGPRLIADVRPALAELVAAPEAERDERTRAFAGRWGESHIEAIKRFRNDELLPLFFELLAHDAWTVRHRALFALEDWRDPGVVSRTLDAAWPLLRHPERRLREKAAITLLKLWDGRKAPDDLPGIREAEIDAHVRAALAALAARIEGRLEPRRLVTRHLEKGSDGLLCAPFLSGWNTIPQVAPGYRGKANTRTAGGGGRREPSEVWTTPLLGWGEEVVQGTSLQPFANLRGNGTVYHLGLDVGACMDGAGYYACADGVVRMVHAGNDLGTLLVVEHRRRRDEPVCALYMHAGDTVFVEPGDEVVAGQLIATMGMGFSIENGGHYAHLHFGLYPGDFEARKVYGYRGVAAGLADWFDPALRIPEWTAQTRPLVEYARPLGEEVARIRARILKHEYARAYADALALQESCPPGSEPWVDAGYLVDQLRQAPGRAVARAEALRDAGYPGDAIAELEETARRLRGVPGAEALVEAADAWRGDGSFARALKGEAKLDVTRKRAERTRDADKARALWEKLREEYGDTCLKPRIDEALR